MSFGVHDTNTLTRIIIGCAIDVHRELGPGLLESAYEACLGWELEHKGLTVDRQKALPVRYKGLELDAGYRIDLLVENRVILELKAIETVLPVHKQQLLSYLRLTNLNIGLLINFNVPVLTEGIHRLINNRSGAV